MAYKLNLTTPYNGMSYIWNVSNHVGDARSCMNASTDVDLVKILIAEWIRVVQPTCHPSCREEFRINGQMDVHTAYWIHAANAQHSRRYEFAEEGTISPARGSSFGGDTWSIVKLNYTLKTRALDVWQDLPNHRSVSPALRAELGRTSP